MAGNEVIEEKIKNVVKEQAECKKERIESDKINETKIEDLRKEFTKEIKDLHWKVDNKNDELKKSISKNYNYTNIEINKVNIEIHELYNKFKDETKEEINEMNGAVSNLAKTLNTASMELKTFVTDKIESAVNKANKFKDIVLYSVIGFLFTAVCTMGGVIIVNFNKIFP